MLERAFIGICICGELREDRPVHDRLVPCITDLEMKIVTERVLYLAKVRVRFREVLVEGTRMRPGVIARLIARFAC